VRSDVPRELEAIVAKCMEKRPSDRYQTIAEFAEALRPFAPAESMRSISRISGIIRSVAPPPPSPEAGSTTLRSAGARTPPEAEGPPLLEPITRKDTPGVREPPRRDTPRRRTPRGSEPTELAHDSIQPQMRPAKDTQTDWGRSQPASSRSRRRVILAVGAAMAACVVIGGLAVHWSSDSSAPAVADDAHTGPSPAGQADAKSAGTVPSSAATAIQVTPGPAIDTNHVAEGAASAGPEPHAPGTVAPNAPSETPPSANGASGKATRVSATSAPRVEPVTSALAASSAAPQSSAAKSLAAKRNLPKGHDATTPADSEDPLENRH
jgi:hypothetical protein